MAGGRGWTAVALLLLGATASAKVALEYEPEIGVPNGGPWGIWAWWETCPEDTYATGFSLKVEPYQGIGNDDTALNGVRLFCTSGSHGEKHEGHAVESQSGIWGRWSEAVWCPRGSYLVRFSLRTERPKAGLRDDMGATNIRFACSGGEILEGHGLSWGEYDGWSPSCHKGLCGIQTKQEPLRGALRDDTALNDVRFRCCKH